MAEWSIATVLKTVGPQGTVSSNLTASARSSRSATGHQRQVANREFRARQDAWIESSRSADQIVSILYSLLFGFAMFAASNLVSFPGGFVSGFLEARKRPLGRRAAAALDIVESAVETAVLIAITVKLIHEIDGNPIVSVGLAYGLLVVLEAIALRVLGLSTPGKWMRILAMIAVAGAISALVA